MKSLQRRSTIAVFAVLWYLQFILWTQPPVSQIHFSPITEPAAEPPAPSTQQSSKIAGFIRIPKTGSTSLLKFLDQCSGMQTYDNYLSSDVIESKSERQHTLLNCFYGHNTNSTNSKNQTKKLSCGHASSHQLGMTWNENKEFTNSSVKMFTIVRDPFERMRSLYYFMRQFVNTTQWCIKCGSKGQYEQVISGNFKAWMQLVHREKKAPQFQYQFLDKNVTKAIEMIQGDSPQVTVYLNECFEASLRLFEKQYSLQSGAVNDFVDSGKFQSNVGYQRRDSETELRELAKQWFVKEYKFYDATVEQFQRQLRSLGLDPSILRNRCAL